MSNILPSRPLVGRTYELEILGKALASAQAGSGTATFLRGDTGTGKSRLASAVVEEAAHLGFETVSGQAYRMDTGVPYGLWSKTRRTLCPLLAVFTLACGGGKAHQALWEPSASDLAVQAPDSFMVTFETSAGDFVVAFYRDWAPLGVDRAYHLTRYDFYAGARFFRVNPGLVQFGLSGQPALDSIWADLTIPDDPVVGSNTRGTISFAKAGPGTRNTQVFINRQDNPLYDTCCAGGFPPVGRVVSGMETVDALFGGHGESPVNYQDSIMIVGNDFLDQRYPGLDTIVGTRAGGSGE